MNHRASRTRIITIVTLAATMCVASAFFAIRELASSPIFGG